MKGRKSSPWDLYEPIEHNLISPEDDASVFMREGRSRSPEMNFVRHFFLSAIVDCFSPNQALSRDAKKWLYSDDESYVFSFKPVCSILDLDCSAVRSMVKENNKNFEVGDLRELRNAS